ncbi:MAG TPA: hypothetical protein VJB11_00470 [archaeon]|nr:hypothetical protein [archaeon]
MHDDIRNQITALEKEIEKTKMMQNLGKLPLNDAKTQIRHLDSRLLATVNKLPDYEKQLYMIKREHGRM